MTTLILQNESKSGSFFHRVTFQAVGNDITVIDDMRDSFGILPSGKTVKKVTREDANITYRQLVHSGYTIIKREVN